MVWSPGDKGTFSSCFPSRTFKSFISQELPVWPVDYFVVAPPLGRRENSLCCLRTSSWPSTCTWAGNALFLRISRRCVQGAGLERYSATHSEEEAAAQGAGVPKKWQFVQLGRFQAEFKGSLNPEDWNKAARKPCISDQESEVSGWRLEAWGLLRWSILPELKRLGLFSHNEKNWKGAGDLLSLPPLN